MESKARSWGASSLDVGEQARSGLPAPAGGEAHLFFFFFPITFDIWITLASFNVPFDDQ